MYNSPFSQTRHHDANTMINLHFFGAARSTTGSMHLVEANGKKILLDCGLFQGPRKEAFELNRRMPLNPAEIDAVLLSHAHIDHCGNLPTLGRNGFRGKIYCTPATADLAEILLRDSVHLQLRDLEIINKKRAALGKNLFEPLYTEPDVDRVMRHFKPEPLHSLMDLGNQTTAVFHEAGHILGSALTEINVQQEDGRNRRVVFSGDLGHPGRPLEPPAEIIPGADVLLIESTYADRDHPPMENVEGRIKDYFNEIHQQNARLIIPAFSVGRTQHILHLLNRLFREKKIPATPVVVDSPLSLKATRVYDRHRGNFDAATIERLRAGENPLAFPGLRFIESPAESMALHRQPGPMVIIAASGMCEGGRVLHHLKNNIGDPRNVVLIVGFQAENTLGRRLVEGRKVVRILGDECRVRARVHTINALSAHADRGALVKWFDALNSSGSVSRVFAVHGEDPQVAALSQLLRGRGARRVDAPSPGERFENV